MNITPGMIPWFLPEFGLDEQKRVQNVISSNYLNEGEVTCEFETAIAEIVGVKHCVAVTSGTAAISLALMGLGIGSGDEVLVPDLTFIATANAVRLTGAEVKLVDVEPTRFTIDVNKVADAIGQDTRAIVAVDINGRGCNYQRLEALCRDRGLCLICDSAEALGSSYMGKKLGSFGDAGCFSFSAAKTVSTGQGGMIATNSTDLYHRLLELKDQGRRQRGTGGNDLHPVMGFNFKYTNLQAAVGLGQLERLEERLAHFRKRDKWYFERLDGWPGITLPPMNANDGEVRQWTDVLIDDRSRIEKALKARNIDCRPFWFPLHSQEPYAQQTQGFNNAVSISKCGLWLPSYFGLSEDEADRVCSVISSTLK